MTGLVSFYEVNKKKSYWGLMFDYSPEYVEVVRTANYLGSLILHPEANPNHTRVNARLLAKDVASLICDFQRAGATVEIHEEGSWEWRLR